MRGETEEANALAAFLRSLTEGVTIRELSERYVGRKTLWGEYRSGAKMIPLHLLERIVHDREPGPDARSRLLERARSLHERAETAAARRPHRTGREAHPEPGTRPTPGTPHTVEAQTELGAGAEPRPRLEPEARPAEDPPPGHRAVPAVRRPGRRTLLLAAGSVLAATAIVTFGRPAADTTVPATVSTSASASMTGVPGFSREALRPDGGSRLYRLGDRGIVEEWSGSGTRWTRIGGPARRLYAGDAGLFAVFPGTGVLRRYEGRPGRWSSVGGPGAEFAVNDHLYRLTEDRRSVWQWNGTQSQWTEIGGPAQHIYAGDAGLFATNPDPGALYKYEGRPGHWSPISGPGAEFAVNDHLYRLTEDRRSVWQWNGTQSQWTEIGGPAQHIYAGDAGLFATNPDPGALYKYEGRPGHWSPISGPGAEFAVNDHLYRLTEDRRSVWQWNGTQDRWTEIGGPATGIEAGGRPPTGFLRGSPEKENR